MDLIFGIVLMLVGGVVVAVVAAVVYTLDPGCRNKGSLTRMLARLLPARFRTRLWIDGARWVLGVCVGLAAEASTHRVVVYAVTFIAVQLLFPIDDYLTGSDDRFKRFFEGGRNKVRWLMDLPAPPEPQAHTG